MHALHILCILYTCVNFVSFPFILAGKISMLRMNLKTGGGGNNCIVSCLRAGGGHIWVFQ